MLSSKGSHKLSEARYSNIYWDSFILTKSLSRTDLRHVCVNIWTSFVVLHGFLQLPVSVSVSSYFCWMNCAAPPFIISGRQSDLFFPHVESLPNLLETWTICNTPSVSRHWPSNLTANLCSDLDPPSFYIWTASAVLEWLFWRSIAAVLLYRQVFLRNVWSRLLSSGNVCCVRLRAPGRVF